MTDFAFGQESSSLKAMKQILELAEITHISAFTPKALHSLMSLFQAEAGAIYLHNEAIVQVGLLPDDIRRDIQKQTDALIERLSTGVWRILDPTIDIISTRDHPEHQLTVINTPVLKGTQVIGASTLILPAYTTLSNAQRLSLLQLSQAIGPLAASISEMSQLKKQVSELDLLHHTSQILAGTIDSTALLEKVIQLTANVLDTDATSILLIDETQSQLVFEVCHGPSSSHLRQQKIDIDYGVAGWVLRHKRPVIINDVTTDARFDRTIDVKVDYLTKSIAAVPLKVKSSIIGVLEAINKNSGQAFDDRDLRLLTSIAAQAAIALENAKLYDDLREKHERIIMAKEQERQALARTLHDGTIQQLSAISMNLDYLQKLVGLDTPRAEVEIEKLQKLVRKAAKEARLVLFELRPLILETDGLIPALRRYVDQLNEDNVPEIQADLEILPIELNTHIAGTIFSIVQEAISNAKRHAKASRINLNLSHQGNELSIQIQDDGHGFDVDYVTENYNNRNSLGLLNMQERAGLIGGTLTIQSNNGLGKGTIITLSAPLKYGIHKPFSQ